MNMIKESDLKFLSELRFDARRTLTQLSKKIKVPISTLYDKLKKHEEGQLIKKYTTIVDFNKLGYSCRANLILKTSKEARNEMGAYLKIHPSINNVFKINNGYDFLAEGIFMHVKEMEDFIEELENKFPLTEKDMHFIIEEIKREGFEVSRTIK